jgi:hypothetical protein
MSPSQAIHVWSRCHHCGMNPITGPSFRCETCPIGPDIDLCSACFEGYQAGRVAHPNASPAGTPATHRFARSEGSPAAGLAPWLDISSSTYAAPPVPAGFLVRPEFRYGRDSVFGGYGFIIRFEEQTFLLTALHVMDELIKIKRVDTTNRNLCYTGNELPAHVSSVRLYNVLKDPWMLHELGDAGPMLVLPNARTGDDEPFAYRDIAAFRVRSPKLRSAVSLAKKEPEPGEPIWLAAAMPDRSTTRRAVCVERTPRSFVFRYEEEKEMPKYTSGAPILDRHGNVVGINTGIGRFTGREFGHANPLSSILAHLDEGLSASQSRNASGPSGAISAGRKSARDLGAV